MKFLWSFLSLKLTPFRLESKSKSMCLTKFVTTCTLTYFCLLELDHGTLDQSRNLSLAIHPWRFDNRIEIRILELEINDSRVSQHSQNLARRNCSHSSIFNSYEYSLTLTISLAAILSFAVNKSVFRGLEPRNLWIVFWPSTKLSTWVYHIQKGNKYFLKNKDCSLYRWSCFHLAAIFNFAVSWCEAWNPLFGRSDRFPIRYKRLRRFLAQTSTSWPMNSSRTWIL